MERMLHLRTDRADSRGSTFVEQVREVLSHLYDPSYLQTHPLGRALVGSTNRAGANPGRGLRDLLLEAIGELRPVSNVAADSPTWRTYQILTFRYVEALDVPTILEKLAISRSAFYRDHRRAIEALAALLWERRGHPQETSVPDAIRSIHAIPPLPVQLTSFVGREKELAEISERLHATRLLTLTGTGGCGKTRLALKLGGSVLTDYPDGVSLVELAPLADPSLIPATVAAAVGVQEIPGYDLSLLLVDALRPRRLLLLLDNCEHLIADCARLVEILLRGCPHIRIVATSREILGVPGEIVWRVPSLPTPDPRHVPSSGAELVEAVASSDAVRLLVERAQHVIAGFQVTTSNAQALTQICSRLDGIPLAIELAAARVRVLGVEQITARLDDRFRLLTGGSRTVLRRHQTLRATMDWSHDLLSLKEQILFRRLAVFAGGWTIDAAEAVCASPSSLPLPASAGGEAVGAGEVLDLLTSLVDKSLVVVEDRGGGTRYHYLETVRAYAWQRLAELGEVESCRERHLAWYLTLAERAEPEILRARQVEWLATMESERANLRAALDWGLAHGREASPRLAGALWQCWGIGSGRVEGISWLEAALPQAPERSLARAKISVGLAFCTREGGDLRRVKALTEESLSLFRAFGDHRGSAWALQNLGILSEFGGDLPSAVSFLEESIALFEAVGDPAGVGMNLRDLGYLEYHVALAESGGDRGRGRKLLERSLDLLRNVGDCWNLGWTLRHLGDLARQEGEVNRASAMLEESLDLFRKIGHYGGVIEVLRDLAKLAARDHDDRRARRTLASSIALAREIGHVFELSHCVLAFGIALIQGSNLAPGVRMVSAGVRAHPLTSIGANQYLDYETSLVAARAALGEEAFAAAWAEGQAMTLDQAISYVLREDDNGSEG